MPVHKVTVNGKSGWRYGESGKFYTGSNARQKAIAQAAAIHASQERKMRTTYKEALEKLKKYENWKPAGDPELPKVPAVPEVKMPDKK